MKITVITVCFNSAAHIGDALTSIDSQRDVSLEHIIVDGASLDDTLAVVARHAAPWRTVVSEADRGIYDAMNKGIARASGDVVGFLNADDLLADSRALHDVAAEFEADPSLDAVYADLQYVAADDTQRTVRDWRSGHFSKKALRRGWMPPHPTFYARRAFLARVGGFNTRYRIAADYDLMLRCLLQPDVSARWLPRVVVRMRVGGVSNASVKAMWHKSMEDLRILRTHGVGGPGTLLCKMLQKLPQFFRRRPT